MKHKIKMVITDLDNTLLRRDKTISGYTISALNRLRERGILIAFATARSNNAASQFTAQIYPDVLVCYGGAVVFADGAIIRRHDIPAGISRPLIQACLDTPDIFAIYAINETVALTNHKEYSLEPGASHYTYSNLSILPNNGLLKISVRSRNPEPVHKIALRFPMCDMLRYTGEDMFRFANREAVKWNAIKTVLEYYDFSAADVVAFGDDTNDIEMLRECGTGVSVLNAIDECKAVSNYICGDCDDDGMAKWIDEYLL